MSQARISLDAWHAAGRYISYRGQRIFVCVDGPRDAEALLLIHGFPTASWDWEALWLALSVRYRVFTLDLVGFGFSDKPVDYDYSLIDQADLCEQFLSGEGVGSYHVLAHDYGDSVAQELLARQGEAEQRPRLRSVAFLNGGLFPETHRPLLLQKLLLSPLGPLLSRFTRRARLAASMRAIFGAATPPDDELIDGFWRLLSHGDGRRIIHKLIRYMRERRQYRERWVGALQQAAIPLVLIDGAADPISGAHMARRYQELVPEAGITLLDGIGHYPQVEAPDAVLAAYMAFRGRVSSASN